MDTLSPILAAPSLLTPHLIGRAVRLQEQTMENVITTTAAAAGRTVQGAAASKGRTGRGTHPR